jgi:hypothetical protein
MGIRRFSDSNLDNNVSYASMKAGSIIPSTATGGTQFISGDYVYRRFTASGTLTIGEMPLVCDALIVAGGGGGGRDATNNRNGGGGAGGLLLLQNITIPVGSHAVAVGAGAAEQTSNGQGFDGSPSSIAGFTVAVGGGGGGGGTTGNFNGRAGGSGGGNGSTVSLAGIGGAGTSGQGFAGGTAGAGGSGGGGGSSEPGGVKSAWQNNVFTGDGYAGQATDLTEWGLATSSGFIAANRRWFAGGGSGPSNTPYWASNGGGTTPFGPSSQRAGVINTGSGGIGINSVPNGAGGSGIVIVRYRKELVGL